jgi:hypothetical protein
MPSAADEALAIAEAARGPDGKLDWGLYQKEYDRALAERHERLLHEARGVFRAMDGWGLIEDREGWQETVRKAADDLESGGFLIERLGAERHLDPELIATLLVLRRRLIDEHGAATAAELMLIDVAVLGYFHTLRINGWVGNLAMLVEAEFFRKESLSARFQDRYGRGHERIGGLRVEDHVQRLGEQLLPLLDRCNRLMLRNLKALRAMRGGPVPSVSIGSAGQVNVAAGPQVNVAEASGPTEAA